MIVFILALSTSSFQVKAESYIDVPGGSREVVLVLDSSGSMRNTPISVMKKSAIKFCESMIDAEGSNKIAIVSYSTNVNKTLDFTSDMDAIKNFINSMFASGGTNIADGLKKAKSLLDDSSVNGKKILYCLQTVYQKMVQPLILEDMIVLDHHTAVNMEIIYMITIKRI